jgi:hypothetical protein
LTLDESRKQVLMETGKQENKNTKINVTNSYFNTKPFFMNINFEKYTKE